MKNDRTGRGRPTLLFVVTEDWYFVSHRLPLARAALAAGFDVAIATNVTAHLEPIRQAGITVYPWKIKRGSIGAWSEMAALWRLWRIFRQVRPDLVHQVALKPVLYGSLAARLCGVRNVVSALGGMGTLFSGAAGKRRGLRAIVLTGLRWLLGGEGKVLILQNGDDRQLLVDAIGIHPDAIRLIRGAGVNTSEFAPTPESTGLPMVILPARMLADKGVFEFVEAARLLAGQGVRARFVLVGATDDCNPARIAPVQLAQWAAEGKVEWFGRRDDMPQVFAAASLVVLPSYREGLPKCLLEAAACARAIVTTDVPGCREIVVHEENGLLVPARDAAALAAAMARLLGDAGLRARMGANGRAMVLAEFSEEKVVQDTLNIYNVLLPQMQHHQPQCV